MWQSRYPRDRKEAVANCARYKLQLTNISNRYFSLSNDVSYFFLWLLLLWNHNLLPCLSCFLFRSIRQALARIYVCPSKVYHQEHTFLSSLAMLHAFNFLDKCMSVEISFKKVFGWWFDCIRGQFLLGLVYNSLPVIFFCLGCLPPPFSFFGIQNVWTDKLE